MFRAKLHPKQLVEELSERYLKDLFNAIHETIDEVTRFGGRNDGFDFLGNLGGYCRIMDKNSIGHPCPVCGAKVEKIQYLGGACYYCTDCQAMKTKKAT